MKLRDDQEYVRQLLTDTITYMCQSRLAFKSEASISALIGVTLDNSEVFLVDFRDTVKNVKADKGDVKAEPDDDDDGAVKTTIESPNSQHVSKPKPKRKRRMRRSTAGDSSGEESSGEPKHKIFVYNEPKKSTVSKAGVASEASRVQTVSDSVCDGRPEVHDGNIDAVNEPSCSTSKLPEPSVLQIQPDDTYTEDAAAEGDGSMNCTASDQTPKEEHKSKYKRSRNFQESWRQQFYWLDHQGGLMFCRVCVDYETTGVFVAGSSNFKIESVKSHEKSKIHRQNVLKWQIDSGAMSAIGESVAGVGVGAVASSSTMPVWQQDSSSSPHAGASAAALFQQSLTQQPLAQASSNYSALNEQASGYQEQTLVQVKWEPPSPHAGAGAATLLHQSLTQQSPSQQPPSQPSPSQPSPSQPSPSHQPLTHTSSSYSALDEQASGYEEQTLVKVKHEPDTDYS